MTYKEALSESMDMLSTDPDFRAIGYGFLGGKGLNGTMKMIPDEKICEMPVAEGLMAGVAMGMSLCGLKPMLGLERMDFCFLALDSIVNHLDKAVIISRGEFNPAVIIRIVVGNRLRPLFTGITHTSDYSDALALMLRMPVVKLLSAEDILPAYRMAKARQDNGEGSTLLVEFKDLL